MLEVVNQIVGGILLAFVEWNFVLKVLNNNRNNYSLRDMLLVCLLGLVTAILFLYANSYVRIILYFMSSTVAIKIIFNISYKQSSLLSFVWMCITVISELCIIPILLLLKVNFNWIAGSISGTTVSNLVVCLVAILIVYLFLKPIRKILNLLEYIGNKVYMFFVAICLLSIAILFFNNIKIWKLNLTFITNTIIISLFVFITVSLIGEILKHNKLNAEYNSLSDYVNIYEQMLEKQRIAQHENLNQLIAIKSMIKSHNRDVIDYINSLIDDQTNGEHTHNINLKMITSSGLRGLLYYKMDEMIKQNIKFNINVSDKIKYSLLNDLKINHLKELCKIIGVYLDNAIEATTKTNNSMIVVDIILVDSDVHISISNTYDTSLDLETKLYNKKFDKNNQHGYGLKLVKQIIDHNHMFATKREVIDDLYTQILIIKSL